MPILLSKIFGGVSLVLVIALSITYGLLRHEQSTVADLKAQLTVAKAVVEQCQKNTVITERTNNAYQVDLSRLRADVKRMRSRPAVCVGVARPPFLPAGKGQGNAHDRKDGQGAGLRSDWLQDFSIEAEQYRIDRNACFDFLNQMYDGVNK